MKKLKFIANIFFLLSLILMLLVILQQLNIIHFLPTTIPPYKPSTHESINKAVKYTILKSNLTQNKISPPKKKNILLILIKILLFVCIIIFTFFVVWLSLFITLLSLMTLS